MAVDLKFNILILPERNPMNHVFLIDIGGQWTEEGHPTGLTQSFYTLISSWPLPLEVRYS